MNRAAVGTDGIFVCPTPSSLLQKGEELLGGWGRACVALEDFRPVLSTPASGSGFCTSRSALVSLCGRTSAVLVGVGCSFSGEMSITVSCPFFSCILRVLCLLGTEVLYQCVICRPPLPVCGLSFHFLTSVSWGTNIVTVDAVQLPVTFRGLCPWRLALLLARTERSFPLLPNRIPSLAHGPFCVSGAGLLEGSGAGRQGAWVDVST